MKDEREVASSVILSAFILPTSSLLNNASTGGLDKVDQQVHFG